MKPDLRIDDDMHACCPDCRLGWLIYDAKPRESDASVWNAVEELLPALKAQLESTPLADMPNLGESRRAYRACGKDPGRWRVSSEALYRLHKALSYLNRSVPYEAGFAH